MNVSLPQALLSVAVAPGSVVTSVVAYVCESPVKQ